LRELIVGSVGLSLFIICPRMAGMVHLISKHSESSLMLTALIGSILSIPLVLVIVLVFAKFGVAGALIFCIITDVLAALVMKDLSVAAGIETFVIALFVVIGVKVAPLITSIFVKI
jgi:hypothetical protein